MTRTFAKVGEHVGFKCDVEQYAKVVKVTQARNWCGDPKVVYTVEAPPDGFCGQYIGRSDFHEVDHDDTFDD